MRAKKVEYYRSKTPLDSLSRGLQNPMERKPPRRTRERILALSLNLFNAFGEPNVTTTTIAEGMKISPGNLYYHFRNKDDIVNSIFAQFEREIGEMFLPPPVHQRVTIEDAWLRLHLMFELVWRYRFLYRDLNDLLSRNRTLEVQFKRIVEHKANVSRRLCRGLVKAGEMQARPSEIEALATNMVVVATYWLSYEYVRNPRRFDEESAMSAALQRGCYQVLSMIAPYLEGEARPLFEKLAHEYLHA